MEAITLGTAAITLTVVLFSKKSWPPYLMLALFPICLLASMSGRWKATGFGLFGFIAVVEHSYWTTLLRNSPSAELRHGLLTGQTSSYIFLALQLSLLTGYAWYLIACLQRLRSIEQKKVMRLHAEAVETAHS